VLAILAIGTALAAAFVLGGAGPRLPAWSAFADEQVPTDGSPTYLAARAHGGMHQTFDEFNVRVPAGAREPLTVLVALHGMGGTGEDIAAPLYDLTDTLGWVVVAPTFAYGDWRDPAQITRDETRNLPRLAAFLDRLPELVGMDVKPAVLTYGFSRGGQAAQRFALVYPDRVAGVAVVSSGTYTLPLRAFGADGAAASLPFPYGMADCPELFGRSFDAERLTRVPFWIGIGGRDSDPADVPHQWDPYIGDDRLERAGRFAHALRGAGVNAEVVEFANIGHAETDEIRATAIRFLSASPSR
jgi:pimeloyl-ACP methyl ester carboxylesterase